MAYGLRTSLLLLLAVAIAGWALPRRLLASLRRGLGTISSRLAAAARERPTMILIVIWVVALIPMVHFTLLVRHYAVNVPTQDDWAMAPLIVKAHTGQLKIAEIFQQQQESRTTLPNLIFVLMANREWNVRDQMALSIIAWWLIAAVLFVLLRRSGVNLIALAICFWLTVVTLFSPTAYELWILASGFPSFFSLLFFATGLLIIGARISIAWKFLLCALLALASTFNLAHGLLAWGLTFPLLFIHQRSGRWRLWLAAWVVTALACAATYFSGYQKPAYLPQFAPIVSLFEYISFILQFLGGGLAYSLVHQPSSAAIIFGLIQLALFLMLFVYAVRRYHDAQFIAKVAPWFALALYSMASAFLAALGRVGYGASYALASRYVPFSIGLTLGIIALIAITWPQPFAPQGSRRGPRWRVIAALILVIAYLVPQRVAASHTLFFLRGYSANDRLGKAAVIFSRVFDTRPIIREKIYPPAPDHVVQTAAALDDLNLLRPPLVRSNRLSALRHDVADGVRVAGLCERVTDTGVYQASGWALLKDKGRPADCVLVGYELPGAESVMFAMSYSVDLRWDIARTTLRPNDYLWTGWTATFLRDAVPPGAKLTFWAVDADEPRLYRLDQKSP
ncbi:MAG: hypothetical protein ACJ8M4_06895 [Chthoniobacterales bacterium]